MALALYFENKATKKLYKVLKLDKEKGEITLQGRTVFTEKYGEDGKERFKKMGYELVKLDDEEQAA
jgi:hypothetical protein